MIVSLIVAMDERGGIGMDGGLPWHLPIDLKRFKTLTMGHHLVMGRRTYASIGRPLPGRTSIVITRNPGFKAEGCLVAHSLQEALQMAEERGEQEAFVIGGGQVFAQALPLADRIYLTQVHATLEADVYFPEFEWGNWVERESTFQPADESNRYSSTFKNLERR